MLRVIYTTSDTASSGFYRVRGPMDELRRQGRIEVVPMDQIRITAESGPDGDPVVVGLEDVPEADVLILQRPTNKHIVDAIPLYQERGIAVVVELDDDFENVSARHADDAYEHPFRFFDPRVNRFENWNHLKRACRLADVVTVSTPELRRYAASHGRVFLLRNYFSESNLSIEAEHDGRTVGWGGTVHNHPHDLKVTRGGVARAVRETGARFLVVGDPGHVRQQLALDEEPEATSWLPLDEYLPELARIDVGIVPLENTVFNFAKSFLKGVEYASLGVLPVASDLPEYRELKKYLGDLIELCPDRGRNWCAAVKRHLTRAQDDQIRDEVRDRVADLTLEGNAWRWMEPLEAAVDNRAVIA